MKTAHTGENTETIHLHSLKRPGIYFASLSSCIIIKYNKIAQFYGSKRYFIIFKNLTARKAYIYTERIKMFIILSDEIFLIHLSEKMINMFMMKTNVPCLFGFFFIFF